MSRGQSPKSQYIPNSIGQALFRRTVIRELYNRPAAPVKIPEADSVVQLTF